MGTDFITLKGSLVSISDIDYHVVDTEKMIGKGSQLFENNNQIHFHSSLPSKLKDIDIVNVCSALQYVENYVDLLKSLCAYRARYLLFSKLSAGDIPTFASAQTNIPNVRIPCWFFNVNEIINIISLYGYELIYKSASIAYNQNNLPEAYRLSGGRNCNLLFTLDSRNGENLYD